MTLPHFAWHEILVAYGLLACAVFRVAASYRRWYESGARRDTPRARRTDPCSGGTASRG